MQGLGKFTWPDGRVYEGEYFMDKKHGQGTCVWPNGKKYTGGWSNGKKHGVGVMVDEKGERKGEWSEGKRIKWNENE